MNVFLRMSFEFGNNMIWLLKAKAGADGSRYACGDNARKRELGFLFKSGQVLHQTTLTARSIVFVNDTLLSSLIQAADSLHGGGLGFFRIFVLERGPCFLDCRTGGAAIRAIAQATFFVLPIALDLRLDISQRSSSKNSSYNNGAEL